MPKRSLIVSMSASAWQGCAACERPLIDRHGRRGREALQRLVLVRAHDDRVGVAGKHARDVFGRFALAEQEIVTVGDDGCPPSWVMPISKETRVRKLGFSKSIARVRPRSRVDWSWGPCP